MERFNISIADLHCLSAVPLQVISATHTDEFHLFFDVGFVQGGHLHLTMKKEDALKLMGELAVLLGFNVAGVSGKGDTLLRINPSSKPPLADHPQSEPIDDGEPL